MPALRLRPLGVDDATAARQAHAELEPEGFVFLPAQDSEPWAAYVARLARWRRGIDVPEGLVPSAILVAVVDGEIVGRVGVRLESGGEVLTRSGHVGYGVRPGFRRRGYAGEMLRQAVVVARSHGAENVLVTCDDDNLASAGVILRGGGVEDEPFADYRGVKRRFWIAPRPGELWLRPVGPDDEVVAKTADEELAREDFPFLLDRSKAVSWADYVEKLGRWRRGLDLPVDRVPSAFLLAQVDGEVVGRLSIRFALNAYLRRKGGHIGYGVRPAFRNRGYAREILRQALVLVRAEGVERVLVTCDAGNAASARVIEASGGVEEPGTGDVRRFWIS
jgi:predicted acetyltransferase